MTNLKAVPKKSTDLGGGNAAWGKRVADISRNPNLLSQKPAGYYAEALIKQAESVVELLDGDSCANGPPWCREVLENVAGRVGKQLAYICNGISGVTGCDKFRRLPKLSALMMKLDPSLDLTAKLIKDGIRNAGQAAQDAAKEAAEKATTAAEAAEKATKAAAAEAAEKATKAAAAKAAEKAAAKAAAAAKGTLMTVAKGAGTLGLGIVVDQVVAPAIAPTTEQMGEGASDAVKTAASHFGVDEHKAEVAGDISSETVSGGTSMALSETIAAFIIYLLTSLFTGVFALSIPAILIGGLWVLITSFGCAAVVAVGGAIMEMN